MNADGVEGLLGVFRRNRAIIRGLRVLIVLGFAAACLWALTLSAGTGRPLLVLLALGGLLLWAGFLMRSVRLIREIQAGNVLIAIGRLDDAEARLERILGRISLSERGQFMLFQQLAGLLFRRDRYHEVVAICRELLSHRLGRVRGLAFGIRVMLADCLLLLDRVDEAYAAVRPVYDGTLSLAERMKLLPIQLRYELSANHAGSAAGGLAEKVRVAELLESPLAALVHALLAEACRRQSMPAQQAFLAERARLYHDLKSLADRYPVIAPIAAGQ